MCEDYTQPWLESEDFRCFVMIGRNSLRSFYCSWLYTVWDYDNFNNIIKLFGHCLIGYGFSIIYNSIWLVSKIVYKSSLIVKNNKAIFSKTHKILLDCCSALNMYYLRIFIIMKMQRIKKKWEIYAKGDVNAAWNFLWRSDYKSMYRDKQKKYNTFAPHTKFLVNTFYKFRLQSV